MRRRNYRSPTGQAVPLSPVATSIQPVVFRKTAKSIRHREQVALQCQVASPRSLSNYGVAVVEAGLAAQLLPVVRVAGLVKQLARSVLPPEKP